MSGHNYKVFFTISFVYQVDIKKKVSKSFKSDLDINADNTNYQLTNENVHSKWSKYALKTSLNNLNRHLSLMTEKLLKKKLLRIEL